MNRQSAEVAARPMFGRRGVVPSVCIVPLTSMMKPSKAGHGSGLLAWKTHENAKVRKDHDEPERENA